MTRILLGTLVVAAVSIAAWWVLLLQPARQQATALTAETTALLGEESQLGNQRDQLLALRDQAPVLRDRLDRLSALVPPDPDQARLLELVQGAASASGVAFTSLSFTEPAVVTDAPALADPAVALGSTTVVGSMQATYFQLVDFLRRLEVGSSRAILVTSVGLVEGPAGFPQLDASFTAEIFSLIPAPVVAVQPGVVPPEPADPDGVPATAAPTPVPLPGDAAAPLPSDAALSSG